MDYRFLHFFGAFIAYYVVIQFNSDLIAYFHSGEIDWWFDTHPVITLSGFVSFFFQSLTIYTLLFNFYKRVPWFVTLIILMLSVPFLVGLRYFFQEFVSGHLFGVTNYYHPVEAAFYFIDNLYYAAQFATFGVVYYFIRYTRFQDKLRHELMTHQVTAELSNLRAQVNPHFLFNSLNCIYALVSARSEDAMKAIEHLSEVLRYGLEEQSSEVDIHREVATVKEYLKLQQLRFSSTLHAVWDEEIVGHQEVPPFVLLTALENSFKHGTFSDVDTLRISVKSDPEKTEIRVANKAQTPRKSGSGLGLQGLQRRLELLYPGKHRFEASETNGIFTFAVTLHHASNQ